MNWRRGLAGLSLAGLLLAEPVAEASRTPLNPQPVVSMTESGLTVEWRVPEMNFLSRADGTWDVILPGYRSVSEPSQPRLPMTAILVALPPNAHPVLNIIQREEKEFNLPGPLAFNPRPAGVRRAADGAVMGGAFAPAIQMPFTHDWVELQPLGVVRGVNLARLVFYPAHVERNRLRVTTHLRAELIFNAPPRVSVVSTDPIVSMLQRAVVNPLQVNPAGGARAACYDGVVCDMPLTAGDLAIEVNAPGLTALTYDALASSHFPVDTSNPAQLSLKRAGVEIALEWDGDADAQFEPGERLLFYAAPRVSRWMNGDIYFLSEVGVPALRMSARSADPTGLPLGNVWLTYTAESNAYYTPECYCAPIAPGRDGDRWTWADLRQPGAPTATFPFDLPTIDASQPATLTLWLISYTSIAAVSPDHQIDVSLNGSPVGYAEWDSKQGLTVTLPITPGLLLTGTNALSLTLPGLPGVAVEGAWLDAFSLRYALGSGAGGAAATFAGEPMAHAYRLALTSTVGLRAYDITQEDQPVRLNNVSVVSNTVSLGDAPDGLLHHYALAAENAVRTPVRLRLSLPLPAITGADYLIIAHADFIPALDDLVALRQSQGLSVAMVDVQSIYDSYDGRSTPEAIRAYLADAYANWTPRPTYVLLVGDGTSDPKHYRTNTMDTFIPPYLDNVDPWAGETAADNRYVTLDGADNLPDMLIGRWPVNTLTETQTVADKTIQYEIAPVGGSWNRNAVFVADNADAAGNFPAQAQTLAEAWIQSPFITQTIFYSPATTTITATQQALLSRWNAGAGLMAYFGHASTHQWAAERFFHDNDIGLLVNGPRLPVVAAMTCFTGSFQTPGLVTLDETLVRHPVGGAVAAWGATGLGVSTGHDLLVEGFLRAVYQDGEPHIGLAVLEGKLNLASQNPAFPDLIDTFTLLGDPALSQNLTTRPDLLYLPSLYR